MAGHSKWANIKHRKSRQDAKRGKLFAKLTRAIEAAARNGGADPSANATLATAIQKAKDGSLPRDNIDRAIARGAGELEGVNYENFWYEGYGPGGVALYVEILTDNRNRAASDVRAAFNKLGGSLGEPGSVGYLFQQRGQLLVAGDEETVMEAALEGGADDVSPSDDLWEIVCAPSDLAAVRTALVAGSPASTA
jgi:YebC/PmpR family DNA-binding regulatory protein